MQVAQAAKQHGLPQKIQRMTHQIVQDWLHQRKPQLVEDAAGDNDAALSGVDVGDAACVGWTRVRVGVVWEPEVDPGDDGANDCADPEGCRRGRIVLSCRTMRVKFRRPLYFRWREVVHVQNL
jgi:hypothetical protein